MRGIILGLVLLLLISLVNPIFADRLPRQVPENQMFMIETLTNATGITSEKSQMDWIIEHQRLSNFSHIHDGRLNLTETIANLQWKDTLLTSGGTISLSKKYAFLSRNRQDGAYNLQTTKVLTYGTTDGSHLTGSETWSLDIAGNYDMRPEIIRCVFATTDRNYFPAFCNAVKAESRLINVNSGQISTRGASRTVAYQASTPSALNYIIAMNPDSTRSNVAIGTVSTDFKGAIMEARGRYDKESANNYWNDRTSASGDIKRFQKRYLYESGFTL